MLVSERTISVVLADDDEGYLETLRALVEQQPPLKVVGVALDGIEAVKCVEAIDPDAVVIDLHMPRLDGVSAVRRLRAEHPSLCLIALTGDSDPSSIGCDRRGRRRRHAQGPAAPRPERANRIGAARTGDRGAPLTMQVARAGIEPATPRFSAVCSTN